MSNHDNFEVNFSLKGNASIQIGIYFLLAAYIIKTVLNGFLIDDSPFGMMSAEIIEILVIAVTFFTFLFSLLALYFKGRRKSKKFQYKLWNKATKSAFYKLISSFTILFINLYFLIKQGKIDFIVPVILIIYACILFIQKNKDRRNLLIISGISILLAMVCFLIPSYWYSSIFVLGVAHITYGIVVRQ